MWASAVAANQFQGVAIRVRAVIQIKRLNLFTSFACEMNHGAFIFLLKCCCGGVCVSVFVFPIAGIKGREAGKRLIYLPVCPAGTMTPEKVKSNRLEYPYFIIILFNTSIAE